MKNRLYFRCDVCGGRLRPDYKHGWHYSEARYTPPLRAIVENQKIIAGRVLCRSCCEKFLQGVGTYIPHLRERIMP